MKLLLEWEAAELIGRPISHVTKLRLTGRLAYIPGRPVKIDEADVLEFIAERERQREERAEFERTRKERERAYKFSPEGARKWAMLQILTRPVRRKPNKP